MTRKSLNRIIMVLVCGGMLMSLVGCPAADPSSIIVVNETGQRLRLYIDGIFMNFIEVGQTQIFPDNPLGLHVLTADNFDEGEWGPVQINLDGQTPYVWVVN